MRIAKFVCPTKFNYVRHRLKNNSLRILDIGCGNNSPTTTKYWFPGCHYAGADIVQYNNSAADLAAMDIFYPLGIDGSGYEAIPEASFDFIILHHVLEHMPMPWPILRTICSKLKPDGYIWLAFPSVRSLSLPSAEGSLHFCDDPTHVYLPDVRETSNFLLDQGVRIVHAGRSRSLVRELLGLAVYPIAMSRRLLTGKLSAKGLWYLLGFEDHVLGQRRIES